MESISDFDKWFGEWSIVSGPNREEFRQVVISHLPVEFIIRRNGIEGPINLKILSHSVFRNEGRRESDAMFRLVVEHSLPLTFISDSEPLNTLARVFRDAVTRNIFCFSDFLYYPGGKGGVAILDHIGYPTDVSRQNDKVN